MKIMFLANGNSIHTMKWVLALLEKGHSIHLVSLSKFQIVDALKRNENFTYDVIQRHQRAVKFCGLNKMNYLDALPIIRKAHKKFKPDIVHAHYASSYGFLLALARLHPSIVSIWGSDINDFPKKSLIHKRIIEFVFKRADRVLATSEFMSLEAAKYTKKDVFTTPFGIDMNVFKDGIKVKRSTLCPFNDKDIVIGTIKIIEAIYGIDYLIKAFAMLVQMHPNLPLKLLIVGDGGKRAEYEALCNDLNVSDRVYFSGKVEHNQIQLYHNIIDIFVALSLEEGFGVSVIEAGACKKPVVVSDAGGFKELISNGINGLIVPRRNEELACKAIEKLVLDKQLREDIGKRALEHVGENYNWRKNIIDMEKIYIDLAQEYYE